MYGVKEYGCTIILCALSCGIISEITSEIKGKNIIRFVCGILFAMVLLRPLTQINLTEMIQIPEIEDYDAECFIKEGKTMAAKTQQTYIKEACEAYILDKARILNGDIIAKIKLNEEMIPFSVEILEKGETSIQSQLETILANDLGIPKEHQTWIWNQADNN